MYETKHDADPLEASFAGAEDIAALKAGMADLKAKLDGATVAAARVPLDGAKAATDGKRPFVDRYLRHGHTGGVEVKVTCSIGISTLSEVGSTWEELFKAADESLYVSKRSGRNRSTAWAPSMRTKSQPAA